jgi:hypothetical protein
MLAERRAEAVTGTPGGALLAVARGEHALSEQGSGDCDAEPAGEVVVAGAGDAQLLCAGALPE